MSPEQRTTAAAGVSARDRRDVARYRRLLHDALRELPLTTSECTVILDAVRSAHAARDAGIVGSGHTFAEALRHGIQKGSETHRGRVRHELAEWVLHLDDLHKLALIDAMERLAVTITQQGWKDISEMMRDHGIPEQPRS